MFKKGFLFLVILFTFSFGVFAAKQIDEKAVSNKESWKESFDISEKKPGKYNVMVTAEDQGGNITVEGPHNIFIDPESDLPISGITNPRDNMRVPGNLNIVGTCIDDDAVERVEIILDGDNENPLVATGKDFWSYYLDTTQMSEGAHTIDVYGIDINGKVGHAKTVTWHLDRRQPHTVVTSHEMGALVSGKINISGTVDDGNGIRSLSYSLDGGETYKDAKLKTDKTGTVSNFSFSIDTKRLNDGGVVCWFKAYDNQGTKGMFSYLFFVDNTRPDVKIVSPEVDEEVNGKFKVAGYAKDVIGLESLTWAFGGETGSFELSAGNPYWSLDLDVTNTGIKKPVLEITAKDTVGNITTVKQKLLVNPETDKPSVALESPVEGKVFFDQVYLRGRAKDDDGVGFIHYSVDGGEDVKVETQGLFYEDLSKRLTSPFTVGSHSVSVWAEDIYGTQGDKTTVNFTIPGEAPKFKEITVNKGKGSSGDEEFLDGVELNPEYGAEIKYNIDSLCGLKNVTYKFSEMPEVTVDLAGAVGVSQVKIPVKNCKWGFTEVQLNAKDIYDRETKKTSYLYVSNLSKTRGVPEVVFADNTVSQDGIIDLSLPQIVTGFFVGGNAAKVRFNNPTKFATLKLEGNVIRIIPTGNVIGVSDAVSVVVTTDKGDEYSSKSLRLMTAIPLPTLEIDKEGILDGSANITVKGKAKAASDLTIMRVSYRILHRDENGSWKTAKYNGRTNEFTVSLPADKFKEGVSVVEFRAIDTQNQDVCKAFFVEKMPPVPEPPAPGKKAPPTPAPVLTWIEGKNDTYYTVAYSDNLTMGSVTLAGQPLPECKDPRAGIVSSSKMVSGKNSLSLTVSDVNGKAYTSTFEANKNGNIKIRFDSVNSTPYTSGMEVVVPEPGSMEPAPTFVVNIDSDLPISAVYYAVNKEEEKQISNISVVGSGTYQVSVPLSGFAADLTKISIRAETEDRNFAKASANLSIIRSRDKTLISDEEAVYWKESAKNPQGFVTIRTNEIFGGYANLIAPVSAKFEKNISGLDLMVDEKNINVIGKKAGIYNNVVVVAKDKEGHSYKSAPVSIIVDDAVPSLEITKPLDKSYVQDKFSLEGTFSDDVGFISKEYSIDGGKTWNILETAENAKTFNVPVDLTSVEDGLVPVDVKLVDKTEKSIIKRVVIQKDTKAPEVTVLVPCKEDKVNGETSLVLKISDDGAVSTVHYAGEEKQDLPNEQFIATLVGTKKMPIAQDMEFVFTDKAGNVNSKKEWDFLVDAESDMPVPEIHVPAENEIIQNDFVISGVVIDDDGPSKIWYKIDNSDFIELEGSGSSFSIPVALTAMTDNEHTVTVLAEDIHGIKSKPVVRRFRISLEEPKGAVETPSIEETVNGSVLVSGWASDKNGISKVQVSVDNGVTFNEVAGTEKWTYEFDTRVMQDGTHAIFIKVWDGYNVQGIYSSLINVDNTAPEINLELPIDGSKTTKNLFFSGQTTDNIGLKSLKAKISSLDTRQKAVPKELSEMDFVPEEIITKTIDLSGLNDGFYNIELVGEDAGGNVTRVSRNIELNKGSLGAKIDLLTPLNGEYLQGMFNLYGTVVSEEKFETLVLYVDGQELEVTELSPTGYFKFTLSPSNLTGGSHTLQVRGLMSGSKVVSSNEVFIIYEPAGPWVTIDNFTYGDFAVERPYIEGSCGYALTETEILKLRDKKTPAEDKERISNKAVDYVEISFDNGKTFELLGSTKQWRYRVENEDMPAGYHFLIVRAVMKNGETAVTRSIVQIDKTAPTIKLIAPIPGGSFNEKLAFAGLTSDDVNLKDVKVTLRSGDKSSYEVPSFIQGLYFDWHFLGATMYDVGLGLTFFDDNVKLQAQFGQMTQSQYDMLCSWTGMKPGNFRYGGNVWGAKLLANVGYIPFRYFFGPNWEWLSANIALGANFSNFSETQSGKPQFLSAVLGQIEFPRITIPKQKLFRTFSLYTEFQLWFIPTDVKVVEDVEGAGEIPSMVFQVSAGLRVNVF